ncbi:expressed unknown protein [Seminavis robusta]|uniref:PH domain-containing protein n=1 Tax=Seminavis robusta TaxID=568900 RepID=A0A9N8ES13_9STRA|nr:expressed unknown protein [Seminavis robusta]|eukprot:Sro1668_g289850.1 n/a (802) ;mRNA; r:6351-8756
MPVAFALGAAKAAEAAGSAGATMVGLGMGKTDLDLTRDLFKLQMRQAKRLWTADWAEASVRHGESCMQSAQQHSESQAVAMATYFQAERLTTQSIKLARDQDSRAYELSWRAEVRESLRDELANQNNRFNIIMLCDTVCLSCVFSLIADGSPPTSTPLIMLNVYVFGVGLSCTLFSISLWCSVIVVRRLHEHTASILERKLFCLSDDLQTAWKLQLAQGLPTGPNEMLLVNQAYERWVNEYIDPLGKLAIHLMSMGVVAMFVTAGLLVHNQYLLEYEAPSAIFIFWATVVVTSGTVLFMKFSEDSMEKKKQGVYDISWQDGHNLESGPFAKIIRAAEELFSTAAQQLGSTERMESLNTRERAERNFCAKTKSLHHRVTSLRHEAERRSQTRQEVLQLLTTAAEELDALPEELTSRLNKILHDIDEADARTANLVTMQSEHIREASQKEFSRLQRSHPRATMATAPIDAQRIPVALGSLRKKLGEMPLTTLLRVRNLSDEPLRLKSGLQLKTGKYIQTLNAQDKHDNAVNYYFYPVSEIPSRAEVVIVARSGGSNWIPTSGIDGEIVYENRDETWSFRIVFRNELVKNKRRCHVQATHVGASSTHDDADDTHGSSSEDDAAEQYWQIRRDELDRKANNEVLVTIDGWRGGDARKAAHDHRRSSVSLKSGFLLKNRPFGLRLHWQQRWFELTPLEILYSQDMNSKQSSSIKIKDITSVQPGFDLVHKNVFEIHVNNREAYKLSAGTLQERDHWMQQILEVAGLHDDDMADIEANVTSEDSAGTPSQQGFECYVSDRGTEFMQV